LFAEAIVQGFSEMTSIEIEIYPLDSISVFA